MLVATSKGRVPSIREPIRGRRVVLEPVSHEQVRAFLAGDFSAVRPGEGWPISETVPGSPPWRLSLKYDVEVNWLVVVDGVVIGDCFTHGGADEAGDIEIGYALAEPYRRRGHGTDLVAALAGWLLQHDGIERVVARNIEAGNVGSRRTLERVGFELEWDRGEVVAYALRRERMTFDAVDGLTARQLDLLRRMESLDPPVRLIGGYAEDALLAGSVTRPHVDIDWLFPRRELELRLAQARELGFDDLAVRGESAPGQPFYLYGESDGLELEIGIVDDESDGLWMKIDRLAFEIDGQPAAAGYRLELPGDTFEHPPVKLVGITVWPVSPLALYQMRAGIAAQGSFGKLGEKQLRAMRDLKVRFFPDRSDSELMPRIEPLS